MERPNTHILSDIQYIKNIMELASQHKVLPDWAAIIGGTLVLISTGITWRLTRSGEFGQIQFLPPLQKLFMAGLWTGSAAVSVLLYWRLAVMESLRVGVSPQARPTQLARQAMGPSILAAAVLTLRLIGDRNYDLISGIWIALYGVGLYNAALFSTEEPRLLGLLFILTGVAALLISPGADLWLTALSFGGYHIAFGTYVLCRKRHQ